MLTLDILENVVDEAIQEEIDLIISHHAAIYRPIKHLRTDLPQGRIYQKLLKHDISVYIAHSNLDATIGGVSDSLAKRLGIEANHVLQPIDQQNSSYGIGRIGTLHQRIALEQLVKQVKKRLELGGVRVIGDLTNFVNKVAIVGGDGNSLVSTASFKGADVLITGDINYHVAHEALAAGLSIIDVGHNVEKWALPDLKAYIEKELKVRKMSTEVLLSKTNTNPFQFI